MFQPIILAVIILLGLLSSYSVLAVKPFPPLVPESEQLANNPEELAELLKNVNRHSLVLSIAFSPDGKHLAFGSYEDTVYLWDIATSKVVQQFEEHNDSVLSIAYSPNGKYLASGSSDKTVLLWEVATGKVVQRFKGHNKGVNSVAYSPDGKYIASGSDDNTVRLWEIATGIVLQRLEGHNDSVRSIVYSPNGKRLASCSFDETVRIWEVATGKTIQLLEGHNDSVNSVAYSPNGKYIASGSFDKTVRMWEVTTGKAIQQFEEHSNWILSVAYSSDGKHLASGSSDGTMRMWEIATGKTVHLIKVHSYWVLSVTYSPDGKHLISGHSDGTVQMWEVATGKSVHLLEENNNLVSLLACGPYRTRLASSFFEKIVLWKVVNRQLLQRAVKKVQQSIQQILDLSLAYSSEPEKHLVSDNTVQARDVAPSKTVQRVEEYSNLVNLLAYSPDRKYLVLGFSHGIVQIREVVTNKTVQQFEGQDSIYSVAYSLDGKRLALGFDGTVQLWEVSTGKVVQQFEGHNGPVLSVAFSPKGKHLASGSSDNTVLLWEIATGKTIQQLEGHNDSVLSVVYSPDGNYLASGSSDNTVRLWEIATGKTIQRFEGQNGPVCSVAYSPDGKYLVSGSEDGSIIRWRTEDGQMQEFYMGGRDGLWLSCQSTGKCLRYDNSILVQQLDKFGRLSPILPPKKTGLLKIIQYPSQLQVKEGNSQAFTLTIKNNGQERVFWIDVVHDIVRDKHNLSPLTFFPPETIVFLEPNETKTIEVQVSALANYDNPPSGTYPLNLRIIHAHGELEPITIEVDVYTPNLELKDIVVEGKYFNFANLPELIEAIKHWNFFKPNRLLVSLQNQGKQVLTEAIFRASLANTTLDTITRQLVKTGETFNLSFALPDKIELNQEVRLHFVAKKVLHPIHEWSFPNQPITIPPPPWYFYAIPIITIVILFILLYYWRVFRHPLVVAASDSEQGLTTLALEELVPAQRWLQLAGRWQSLLAREQIPTTRWQTTLSFAQTTEAQQRCQCWMNSLNYEFSEQVETSSIAPWLFILHLDRDFILAIEYCFLAFPPPTLDEDAINQVLQKTANTRILIGILISADSEQHDKIIKLQQKLPQEQIIWIVPNRKNDITRFLLASPTETRKIFAQLIASQAKITRISPYKTGGGVEKASLFFGRVQQLADIIGQESKNYLLVGARQIGKTSLLKELERRYQAYAEVNCVYLSISKIVDAITVQRHIAQTLDLAKPRQQSILLIDEVDDFIHQEAQNHYKTLHWFRNLSAEGHCYFILAGFWDLHQAIYADYHSPLKNFGETVRLGGLEAEACDALATEPMQALNIHYANPALIEQIIQQTGRRANLIANLCHQLLGILEQRRIIEAADLEQALDKTEIHDLILGDWDKTEQEQQSSFLRIIVYLTVTQDDFSENELWQQLDKWIDFPYQPQQVYQALSRLELAFILERKQDRYHYCVPLFYNLLRQKNLSALLTRELAWFKRMLKT